MWIEVHFGLPDRDHEWSRERTTVVAEVFLSRMPDHIISCNIYVLQMNNRNHTPLLEKKKRYDLRIQKQ